MKATQRFFRLLELDRKDISYIYLYALFAGLITLSLPLGIQAIINLMVGRRGVFLFVSIDWNHYRGDCPEWLSYGDAAYGNRNLTTENLYPFGF